MKIRSFQWIIDLDCGFPLNDNSKGRNPRTDFSRMLKKVIYGGRGREVHPLFIEYIKKIVVHANYKGMPWAVDSEGKIRWNAPSHRPPGGQWSDLHDERHEWWKTKAAEALEAGPVSTPEMEPAGAGAGDSTWSRWTSRWFGRGSE